MAITPIMKLWDGVRIPESAGPSSAPLGRRNLVGMMGVMMSGGAAGWTNPYITNGLVAMWDGEWNAGEGVHDNSATVWKDLSGNGYDLVPRSSVDTFGETFCNSRNGWQQTTHDFSQYAQNKSLTIEVCAKFTAEHNNTVIMYLGSGRNFRVYGAYVSPTRYNLYWFALGGTNNTLNEFSPVAGDFTTMSFVVGSTSSFYRDGVLKKNVTFGAVQSETPKLEGLWGNGNYITHSVRIYNRVLTAAEISANSAVDVTRFG